MSELINTRMFGLAVRKLLMGSVSSVVLLTLGSAEQSVQASDSNVTTDEPTVWLSVESQLDQLSVSHEAFVPEFFSQPYAGPHAGLGTSLQRAPNLGFDLDASLSIRPSGSQWSFSASVQYGRALSSGQIQITNPYHFVSQNVAQRPANYDGHASNRENHTIVDFKVGRDLGIGVLGTQESVINFGVRFAQLGSQSHFHATSGYFYGSFSHIRTINNAPDVDFARSFRGAGPQVAWEGSVPVLGNKQTGELMLDWGINAALLFGKQKTRVKENSRYYQYGRDFQTTGTRFYHTNTQVVNRTRNRSHSVIIPNPGVFAGISYRMPNARLSVGYRADFFLGAVDGGVDVRKNFDRSFYGPFAKISIGLGG